MARQRKARDSLCFILLILVGTLTGKEVAPFEGANFFFLCKSII